MSKGVNFGATDVRRFDKHQPPVAVNRNGRAPPSQKKKGGGGSLWDDDDDESLDFGSDSGDDAPPSFNDFDDMVRAACVDIAACLWQPVVCC